MIASAWTNIVLVLEDMEDPEESLLYLKKALLLRERKLGRNSIPTSDSHTYIGNVQMLLGDFPSAHDSRYTIVIKLPWRSKRRSMAPATNVLPIAIIILAPCWIPRIRQKTPLPTFNKPSLHHVRSTIAVLTLQYHIQALHNPCLRGVSTVKP